MSAIEHLVVFDRQRPEAVEKLRELIEYTLKPPGERELISWEARGRWLVVATRDDGAGVSAFDDEAALLRHASGVLRAGSVELILYVAPELAEKLEGLQ